MPDDRATCENNFTRVTTSSVMVGTQSQAHDLSISSQMRSQDFTLGGGTEATTVHFFLSKKLTTFF